MNNGDDLNDSNGFSYALLNDTYAAGCAALAIGGPLLIPFALKYGRRPVYVFSSIAQFAIAIWTAKLQTVGDLVAVNTLNCLFGSLAEIIVQMTVADVFFVHERGRMNSFYLWSLNIGSLASIAGGYITVNQGWRWVWWWMVIFFGITIVIYVFLFEESKYPDVYDGVNLIEPQDPILNNDEESKGKASDSKAAEAATTLGEGNLSTAVAIDHTIPLKSYRERLELWSTSAGSFGSFFRHSYQPLIIFGTIPAVFYMSLVYSMINATITVMITVLSEYLYYPPYNFSSAQVGLMSLPAFIGSSLGLLICGPVSDWGILYLAKRNKGIYEPEMRLWIIAAFIPFVPTGLFMFGFGLANGFSWPIIAVGYALLSFGTAPASSIALTYLMDAYTNVSLCGHHGEAFADQRLDCL
jgi:MFS family permease